MCKLRSKIIAYLSVVFNRLCEVPRVVVVIRRVLEHFSLKCPERLLSERQTEDGAWRQVYGNLSLATPNRDQDSDGQ